MTPYDGEDGGDMTHEPDIKDAKIRDMLMKSGFNVLVIDDVNAFSKFMRAMFLDYEQQQRGRDTKRTVFIALGVGLTTTLLPLLLHFLKVL